MKGFLLGLFVLISVRFIFFIFYFQHEVNIHMLFRFDERALAVMNGQTFKDFAAWGSYPLLLGYFYKLLDIFSLTDERLTILYWLNQILSLSAVLLISKSCNFFQQASKKGHLIFWIFFGLNPFFIYLSAMNMSESAFIFCFSLFFIFYKKFQKSGVLKDMLFAGILLGVAFALRNILLLFLIFLISTVVWGLLRRPSTWQSALILIGSLLLVPALLGIGNSFYDLNQQGGASLNRGPNLAQTWCEAQTIQTQNQAGSFWFRPPEYRFGNETEGLYVDQPFQNTSYFTSLAVGCLIDQPALIFLRLRSVLNAFDGVLYPDPLKVSESKLSEGFRWLHLFLFSLVLLSVKFLWKNRETQILLVFVVGCLGSIYIGNVGEMRFLFSFYPALVVLAGLTWINESTRAFVVKGFFAALIASLLMLLPSLSHLQEMIKNQKLNSLTQEEVLVKVQTHQSFLKSDMKVCENENNFLESLAGHSDPKKASQHYLSQSFEQPLTEIQYFCRNLLLVKLRNQGLFKASINDIGYVNPLPGGLGAAHPLVAIAGQFLYNDLLIGNSGADLILQDERYYSLFKVLFKYQHRLQMNRPDMLGKVVRFPKKGQPDPESEKILELTFQSFLDSLRYFEGNNIRFDYLKLQ